MMSCILEIQHFDILSYKNTQIGIRIDAKHIFIFFVFSVNAFEKRRFDDEKN